MPSWSKLKKLYSASGAIWISSTSSSALVNGLSWFMHLVALHREQADFRLEQEAALLGPLAQRLVVPDHVFQRERNLLPRLVLDDLADLARLDRRQLNEAGQGRLPRHADRHQVVGDVVLLQELVERLRNQLFRNGVGLTENFGMGDVVKGRRLDLIGRIVDLKPDGLQTRLPDVDPPSSRFTCHASSLQHEFSNRPRVSCSNRRLQWNLRLVNQNVEEQAVVIKELTVRSPDVPAGLLAERVF